MFRPTYFAILFALVLCATAFPADPVPEGLGSKLPERRLTAPKEEPGQGSTVTGEAGAAKGDLDTDATVHFGYAYYGPRWGYYAAPWGVKAYSWGPVWL